MSSKSTVTGPDEDEHYENRELGHPNKALRHKAPGLHYAVPHDISSAILYSVAGMASPEAAASPAAFGTSPQSGLSFPFPPVLSSNSIADDADSESDVDSGRGPPPLSLPTTAAAAMHPQLSSQLDALVTNSAAVISLSGASLQEQVRVAKDQAIEILHVLDAENMLEHGIAEYINDVEASFSDLNPKTTFPKLRAAWTREEDRLLTLGVRVYGPNTESWPRIATLVPGRTNKSCRKRWFHSLDPSLHKGPWTPEEDEVLRQRVLQFPSQWSRVAEGIVGRTDDQCAKRWRESLDPEIDRGKWRPEEDRLLLEKFAEFGTQWQKIATYFQGRPGLHCRNRWRKIQRIISQKERKTGPIPADNMTEALASVTESVNRRKTAQRSRVHYQTCTTRHAGSLGAVPGLTGSKVAEGKVGGVHARQAALDTSAGPAKLSLKAQRRGQSQEMLYMMSPLSIPADAAALAATDMRGIRTPQSLALSGSQHQFLGSPQQDASMGALFMPSEPPDAALTAAVAAAASSGFSQAEGSLRANTLAASASHHQSGGSGGGGGAKRSASMLFSPTEEQRQRLQRLGLRLYGCAAAPALCNASFADSLSLNSHLKLAHPQIASLIPLLNNGSGAAPASSDCAGGGMPGSVAEAVAASIASAPQSERSVGSDNAAALGKGPRPYRCAMPTCNHAYKNISGLEYHIFQSRKASSHLMLASPSVDQNATDRQEGGLDDAMPDISMAEPGVYADMLGGVSHMSRTVGGGDVVAGASSALSMPGAAYQEMRSVDSQPLQCTEVDCLARFATELDLRQHVAAQHPRPIRRAIKPSNRVKAGRSTPTDPLSLKGTFWGTATISDVLGAAAMDAPAMPTIPEGGISTSVSQAAAAAAAIAAVMGYGDDAQGLALRSNTPGPPQSMLSHGGSMQQHVHRQMAYQGPPNQPYFQAAAAPFLSAPALISANGGEPGNIGSYFSLGLNNAPGASGTPPPPQQQQQQHYQPMAPVMFGASSASNIPVSSESAGAAAASMMLEAINQAAVGAEIRINGNPAGGPVSCGMGSADNMAMDMQLMRNMMNPSFFIAPSDGDPANRVALSSGMCSQPAAATSAVYAAGGNYSNTPSGARNGEADVRMGDAQQDGEQGYARSHRSDSFDLSSLATVPSTAQHSAETMGDASDSQLTANSAGTKAGAHSQMAAALMSKRNRQQQQASSATSSQAPTPTGLQQPLGILPWTQSYSALSMLPFSSDSQNRHSMHDGLPQPHHHQRLYTPQPMDLAQFQFQSQQQPQPQTMLQDLPQLVATAPNSTGPRYQRQFASTLHLNQHQQPSLPHLSSNSFIQCPAVRCSQAFTDANALKQHLHYDHPHDVAIAFSGGASNPGSPMEGFLSTMPTNHQAPPLGLSQGPLSAGAVLQPQQPHSQSAMLHLGPATASGVLASDRAKAPHWVNPSVWSMWIAAANGQGDVTATATATAMGITPGVSGPQSFIPASSTPLAQPTYSHLQHPTDTELLRMFQSANRTDTS
ncbi:hypothetical protein H4R26_000362 [Coemansia thaxteri]|uniref:Uncharacterized protein n=1 Tax=Coemansia thaxteri TaxID=2663907 RepID=A0A9W8EK92_9FUNG|nr:hypothetical protein H4R26_000362 [Coemansia thaxteri]